MNMMSFSVHCNSTGQFLTTFDRRVDYLLADFVFFNSIATSYQIQKTSKAAKQKELRNHLLQYGTNIS